MRDEQETRERRLLRVRFAADPASVPGARKFVSDGLRAWGLHDLVDDASLCVSELAGNAALHGSGSYIEVSVLDLEQAVRLSVEDDGPAPAAVVAPRTTLPGLDDAFDDELDGSIRQTFGELVVHTPHTTARMRRTLSMSSSRAMPFDVLKSRTASMSGGWPRTWMRNMPLVRSLSTLAALTRHNPFRAFAREAD